MKKKIFALVLALVMALSLAACGNSNTPATSGSASGSGDEPTLSGDLVLYCTMTENDIQALLDCFNEVYPDINVEVVNGSAGELVTRLQGLQPRGRPGLGRHG